jgi:RNase H-fold protein (predicted Holliday junction resolvase)
MNNKNKILAVIPGRRRIGFAVFYNQNLVYYGGTSLARFKTKQTICEAVEKFMGKHINRFEINGVAVRRLDKSQEISPLLVSISKYLKTICKAEKLELSFYDGKFINTHFCKENERPTKEKTAAFLAAKYPELNCYYKLKKDYEKKYYAFVFQAIALGLVCLAELDKKENRKLNI